MEAVTDFIFLGSKITADGDCSHEIKRHLLPGRKAMTNLDNVLKSRDITLPTKVCIDNAMVFPIVIYGCESWTVKKAERRRIDAFALWCWRRLLRVPRTARRSNQDTLKDISPECSLEGSMMRLKLQHFCHWLIGKDPDAGNNWGQEKAVAEDEIFGWHHWLNGHEWANSGSWWWIEKPDMLQFMGSQSRTWLCSWTITMDYCTYTHEKYWPLVFFLIKIFLVLLSG